MPVESSKAMQQYSLVTASYWAFTLTDGALRMLVLLFFHGLGFSPIEIASLFVLYELSGVVTNLLGGWVASRIGLTKTLQLGLVLQILAIAMLLKENNQLTVLYVMCAQALSGVGKDLNKLSAKSSIKALVAPQAQNTLFTWVALLTGSKNALKGIGFFMGGALLSLIGFQATLISMIILLGTVLVVGWFLLSSIQQSQLKPTFTQLVSKSSAINRLSFARMLLFGARDIWFVVALPVFLQSELNWSYWQVGSLMALWVIGYGGVQAIAPQITSAMPSQGQAPAIDGRLMTYWGSLLVVIPLIMVIGLKAFDDSSLMIILALVPFAFVFAINSSAHSYLILAYAAQDSVSLDVGFYYMANAGGRLLGTILSGIVYQSFGLASCLLISSVMILFSTLVAKELPAPGPS